MMDHITSYDHCLRFQVLDKIISCIDEQAAEVVADNRGNICIHIEFDSQWDGCGKTARFIYNENWVDCPLNVDNECICPSEVVKKGRFLLGVYGAELKTTTPIVVNVRESILSSSGGELPPDPTPGQYEQIMALYAATTQSADAAVQATWEAIEKADFAIKSLNAAKKELEEAGFIEGIKEINQGATLRFWAGNSDEYEKEGKHLNNTFCIVTDDSLDATFKEYDDKIANINRDIEALGDKIDEVDDEIIQLSVDVQNADKKVAAIGGDIGNAIFGDYPIPYADGNSVAGRQGTYSGNIEDITKYDVLSLVLTCHFKDSGNYKRVVGLSLYKVDVFDSGVDYAGSATLVCPNDTEGQDMMYTISCEVSVRKSGNVSVYGTALGLRDDKADSNVDILQINSLKGLI